METFFFEKKTFFIIFSNFSHVGNFLIFCFKNLMIRAEMTVLRTNTIWYAFYSKFATFRDFEQIQVFFFEKIIYFFQKRAKFWRFWGMLLFQSHSAANLLQFGQKIISRSVTWTYLPMWRERNWQTSGKKKRRKWPIGVKKFAFIFLRIWRKTIKQLRLKQAQGIQSLWLPFQRSNLLFRLFCFIFNIKKCAKDRFFWTFTSTVTLLNQRSKSFTLSAKQPIIIWLDEFLRARLKKGKSIVTIDYYDKPA